MAKGSDARWLGMGGALLCGLAALFGWRELAISPEYLLSLAALAATVMGLLSRPRTLPDGGLFALCGCALVAGAWFAGGAVLGFVDSAAYHPVPLLVALGLSLTGALAVSLTTESSTRKVYALTAIFLVATAALYYQLFTVGFAEDQVARRMVLTLVWLASGLALLVREQPWKSGGRVLVLASFIKALAYDTTHLDGALRILLLLATGGLLIGGAWALERREAA